MSYSESSNPANPPDDAVRARLELILASPLFTRARRQSTFLRHVVESTLEGRTDALREADLGISVFSRGADFDPRADNIVRVEARRLRQRLQQYYGANGDAGDIVIDLPVGSYVPVFSYLPAEVPTPIPPPGVRSEPAPAPVRWARMPLVASIVVCLGVAAMTIAWFAQPKTAAIAVLPFQGFNFASGDQYRADGITEDITQILAETPRLRVVARTSTLQFRDRPANAAEIGRRLGVPMLLEGSVQPAGEGYRISARLIQADNGFQVWSGTQETDAAGLSAAERAIASGVAIALGIDAPRTATSHVPTPEVQDLLLRARYLAARPGAGNRASAIALYRRAVLLDPNYGRAWGELARLLSLIAFHDSASHPGLAPQIKAAAERALILGSPSADPYLALARLAWANDWDWQEAETNFKRALDINPNYGAARQSYALGLVSRRRFSEALYQSQRAMQLDPLSFAASNDLGVVLYASRRFEEAESHARRSIALTPESTIPRFLLGVALCGLHRYSAAIPELERVVSGAGRNPEVLGRLGNAYAQAGRTPDARAVLKELMENPAAPRIYSAMVETGLGNLPAALSLIEESAGRRETDFLFLPVDSVFDPLRRQPRYAALCARLQIPPG